MSVRRLAPKELQPESFTFTQENLAWAKAQIEKYPPGRQASAVIAILWRVQEQHEGWVSEAAIRAVADLTAAEINLSEVAWAKPPGQRAELRFDLGKRRDGNMVLQNFRLDSDTIGINGWVALGADNRPIEYLFTDFSLNTVSNLSVRGTLRPDRIWEIKANGARFDAQGVFRGFLNVGKVQHDHTPSRSGGIDIDASFDTVSGVPDVINTAAADPLLRKVRLRMSRRGDDLQDLQFSGRHDNGLVLKASMKANSFLCA